MYQQNANQVAYVVGTFLPLVLSCLGCGLVAHLIARKKGYSGYFWTGFFLLVFGVMYVASLPFPSALPSDEQKLLDHYRSLDATARKALIDSFDSHKVS